jgi:hypothetical protein
LFFDGAINQACKWFVAPLRSNGSERGMSSSGEIILNDLAHLPVWVGWREEQRNDKATKVPYSPRTGWEAKSNDAKTWATRGEAEAWAIANRGDGVGIMLSRINGGDCCLSGIDLDSCRDPNTETLQGWAREVINRFATYTEMGNDQSRSGKAFRKGAALKAAGYSYDAMRDALLADEDPEIAEWARTKGLANGERELHRIYDNAGDNGAAHVSDGVSLDDFNAYMPMHSYIFTPAREMWPASSINAKIPPLIGEN